MILYYTRSNKTKVCAEALHDVTGLPLYRLESDLNEKTGFRFIFKVLQLVFTGKDYPISNMPTDLPDEIYLCGPIWGGQLAGPLLYFLNNMNSRKCRVNLLRSP